MRVYAESTIFTAFQIANVAVFQSRGATFWQPAKSKNNKHFDHRRLLQHKSGRIGWRSHRIVFGNSKAGHRSNGDCPSIYWPNHSRRFLRRACRTLADRRAITFQRGCGILRRPDVRIASNDWSIQPRCVVHDSFLMSLAVTTTRGWCGWEAPLP